MDPLECLYTYKHRHGPLKDQSLKETNVAGIARYEQPWFAIGIDLSVMIIYIFCKRFNISENILHVKQNSFNLFLPVQVLPFPVKPALQAQVKAPIVFLQSAFLSQSCLPVVHSLISKDNKCYE
jgi:hypothetical protein